MSTPARPVWFWIVICVAAAFPAGFTLFASFDQDTWWHLAVGRWIWSHEQFPITEPFSRLGTEHGATWVAYSWLYEIGMFGISEAFGPNGISIAKSVFAAITVGSIFLYALRREMAAVPAVVILSTLAISLIPFMRERPWHFTVAFTVITLEAIGRVRDGSPVRRMSWLPLLFILWANIHIQFVLGWLILGMAVLFPGKGDPRKLFVLAIACGLATFVNPYGTQLLRVIWEYATQAAPRDFINELAPPEISSVCTWAVFGLMVWAGLVGVRQPRDGFKLGLLIVAVILSTRMRRDTWFGVLAAVAILRDVQAPFSVRVRPLTVAMLVCMVFAIARGYGMLGYGPKAVPNSEYPLAAMAHIREKNLPGPLYNDFNWGGAIIWGLPNHPVAIDGRTNLYGSDGLRRAFATWDGTDDWRTDKLLTSANLVIAPKERILAESLRNCPEQWAIAFEDDLTIVFTRVNSATE